MTEEAPAIEEVHNEIELLHELNNGPNIIELFDVYETQTYVFLGRLFEIQRIFLDGTNMPYEPWTMPY